MIRLDEMSRDRTSRDENGKGRLGEGMRWEGRGSQREIPGSNVYTKLY